MHANMHSRLARPQYQVYLPVLYSVFSLKKIKKKKAKREKRQRIHVQAGNTPSKLIDV